MRHNRNAKALEKPIFRQRVVRPRKGKGSYRRNRKEA